MRTELRRQALRLSLRLRQQVRGVFGVVQPALDLWSTRKPSGFPDYAAGSDGPSCSDALLHRDGRSWRKIG